MKKFVCTVCGYVYEGEAAPEKCPVCGVGADKFTEVKEGERESMKLWRRYLQLSNNITLTRPTKKCSKHPEN